MSACWLSPTFEAPTPERVVGPDNRWLVSYRLEFELSQAVVENSKLVPRKKLKSSSAVQAAPHHQQPTDDLLLLGDGFPSKELDAIRNLCENVTNERILWSLSDAIAISDAVAITFIASDLSSGFSRSATKICRPSQKCLSWFCPCERSPRALLSTMDLFLALIHIPEDSDKGNDEPLASANYCLSLYDAGTRSEKQHQGDAAALAFSLSRHCDIPLSQRYEFIQGLLWGRSAQDTATKVVYNAQLAAMAFQRGVRGGAVGEIFDPKIAAWMLDTNSTPECLEFSSIAKRFAPQSAAFMINSLERADSGSRRSLRSVIAHALSALSLSIHVAGVMQEKLENDGTWDAFSSIESPLAGILASMEVHGLVFLTQVVQSARLALEARAKNLASAAHQAAGGYQFSLTSPAQVSHCLFGRLKLCPPKNVSTLSKKHLPTGEDVIKEMKRTSPHPILDLITQHRSVSKVLNSYVNRLQEDISLCGNVSQRQHPSQHRFVHPHWHQCSVRTGRLSCTHPNLQNMPKAKECTDIPVNIRNAFVAPDGFILVSADYNQIEMRVLAHLSKDKSLQKVFSQQGDVYKILAGQVFGEPVSEMHRQVAKVVVLGKMYGMGPVSLISLNSTRFVSEVAPLISIPAQHLAAQKLNISVQEATSFMQDMDRAYAGIGRYQQLLIAKAMQDGYVETITGRRRKLLRKSIGSLTSEEKGELHRQAVNSVIQGSAADIIKLAMLRMDEKIQEWHLTPSPQLVMQIHDELIFSCPDDEESVRALINTLKEVMEESVPRDFMIATKLKISVAAGKQWGSMIQIN